MRTQILLNNLMTYLINYDVAGPWWTIFSLSELENNLHDKFRHLLSNGEKDLYKSFLVTIDLNTLLMDISKPPTGKGLEIKYLICTIAEYTFYIQITR